MAITLTANYQKRLGLPGYSSHSFQVSLESEITDLGNVQGEVTRLYGLLQDAVDREMHQTGFVPDDSYGESSRNPAAPAVSHGTGSDAHHQSPAGTAIADPHGSGNNWSAAPTWQCSAKQHTLINDLARRIGLDDQQIDDRAQRLFRKPAHQLNKLSASGLISDLLAEAGPRRAQNGNHHTVPANRNGGEA